MKGSMARAETEELAGRPVFIALQVLPVSVLLNTPPPSCAPAYSVLGVRGSMASAPMAAVAGPWLVQALMPACTVCALATKSTTQMSAGVRRLPRALDRYFADLFVLAPLGSFTLTSRIRLRSLTISARRERAARSETDGRLTYLPRRSPRGVGGV